MMHKVRGWLAAVVLIMVGLLAHQSIQCGHAQDPVAEWLGKLEDPGQRADAAYNMELLGSANETTVARLIEALQHKDPNVRRYVASALGELGAAPKLAGPALIEALLDSDNSVREHAAMALRKLGRGCLPELLAALKRKDRPAAVETPLSDGSELGPAPAPPRMTGAPGPGAPPLALPGPPPALPRPPMPGSQFRLADYAALALSGAYLLDEDLPEVEKALYDRDWEVRGYALYVLEKMGKPAVPILRKGLEDPDRVFRMFVVFALGRVGARDKATVEALLPLLRETEESMQGGSSGALGLLIKIAPQDEETVRTLMEMLKVPQPAVAFAAAQVLLAGGFSGSEVVETLFRVLNSPQREFRHQAASLLAGLAKYRPTTLPLIKRLASEAPADSRVVLVESIRGQLPPRVQSGMSYGGAGATEPGALRTQLILKLLGMEISRGRRSTSSAGPGLLAPPPVAPSEHGVLRKMASDFEEPDKTPEGLVDLLAQFVRDPDDRVRMKALPVLVATAASAKDSVGLFEKALLGTEIGVRREALKILGDLPEPPQVPTGILCQCLRDEDQLIRLRAMKYLTRGRDNDPQVTKCLVELVGNPSTDAEITLLSSLVLLRMPEQIEPAAVALRKLADSSPDQSLSLWASIGLVTAQKSTEDDRKKLEKQIEAPNPEKELELASISALAAHPPINDNDVRLAVKLAAAHAMYYALDRIPGPVGAKLAQDFPKGDESIRVRIVGLAKRIASQSPEAASVIQKAKEDPSPRVRSAAQEAPGRPGAPVELTLAEVEEKLQRGPRNEKVQAAVRLATLKPERTGDAVRIIIETAIEPIESPSGRGPVAPPPLPVGLLGSVEAHEPFTEELVAIGAQAVDELLKTLEHPHVTARKLATAALLRLKPCSEKAVDALIEAAKDPNTTCRARVIRCLGNCRPPTSKARSVLTAALKDDDLLVRTEAGEAILNIGIRPEEAGTALFTITNDEAIREFFKRENIAFLSATQSFFNRRLLPMFAAFPGFSPGLPVWSTAKDFNPHELLGKGMKTLGDVHKRLVARLEKEEYPKIETYSYEGGFTLLVSMERIEPDGKPHSHRWELGKIPLMWADLRNFSQTLFFADMGHFRRIVFVITDEAVTPDAHSDASMGDKLRKIPPPVGILPPKIAKKAVGKCKCHAIVYQFEKKNSCDMELVREAAITAKKHLELAGLMGTDNSAK